MTRLEAWHIVHLASGEQARDQANWSGGICHNLEARVQTLQTRGVQAKGCKRVEVGPFVCAVQGDTTARWVEASGSTAAAGEIGHPGGLAVFCCIQVLLYCVNRPDSVSKLSVNIKHQPGCQQQPKCLPFKAVQVVQWCRHAMDPVVYCHCVQTSATTSVASVCVIAATAAGARHMHVVTKRVSLKPW